jgi:hypothetical protein
VPGLGNVAGARWRGVGLAAEEDELEGLSAGKKGRCQLGHVSPDPGRRRAERAAVDPDFELTGVIQNAKCKMQNEMQTLNAILILHLAF